MRKYLRTILVTFLVSAAGLMAAGAILFNTQHLHFYDPRQAQAKFAVSQSDLALIRDGQPGYVWVLPKAGYAINSLRQSRNLVGLVYAPALIIILYEIRRLSKHRAYEITSGQSS